MNDSIGIRIFGWLFFLLGALIIGLGAVTATQRSTIFIYDSEIFRVVIIGLVMFIGGSLTLHIYRIEKALQKFTGVSGQ